MKKSTTVCVLTDNAVHAVAVDHGRSGWRTIDHSAVAFRVPDSILGDEDIAALAARIADVTRAHQPDHASITLVVPLQWCFTQVLEVRGRTRRQQLLFELESYLPLPLEQLTCTTIKLDDGHVLGIGIATEPMQELIGCLQDAEIDVDRVLVDGILLRNGNGNKEAIGNALVDARWTRVVMRDGRTVVFPTPCTPSAESIHEAMRSRALLNGEPPSRLSLLDLTEPGTQAVETNAAEHSSQAKNTGDVPCHPIEAIAIAAVAQPRPIDLRTGALACEGVPERIAKLIHHCLLLLLICGVIAGVGAMVQRAALREQQASIESACLDVYRQVFAVDQLPPGAALRLASERVRLEGLTRGGSKPAAPANAHGPLEIFREIVSRIPEDVRITLDDTRLDEHQLTLRGRTAGHRDAERIFEAIGGIGGLQVRPPRTTRLKSGGVEFWIVATRTSRDD